MFSVQKDTIHTFEIDAVFFFFFFFFSLLQLHLFLGKYVCTNEAFLIFGKSHLLCDRSLLVL